MAADFVAEFEGAFEVDGGGGFEDAEGGAGEGFVDEVEGDGGGGEGGDGEAGAVEGDAGADLEVLEEGGGAGDGKATEAG